MINYFSLFVISFLAGSFVPLGSEIYLLYLDSLKLNTYALLLIASIGNTFGGMTCYFIIKKYGVLLGVRYLKISPDKLNRWSNRLKGKGEVIALLAWLPFVGEVIAAICGLFQLNMIKVFLFMFLGKFLRYLAILKIVSFTISN